MELDDATIREVTDQVCETLLHVDVAPGRAEVAPGAPFFVGSVDIHGSWEGAVTLACAGPLARRAAGTMLDVAPGEVTGEDVRDALGEITNILGGNVKALLPAPSRLSLPEVRECPAEAVPAGAGEGGVHELWFSCGGEAMVVRLVRRGGGAP
ncbi:MAG: chemotaxis protein CheX [Polyangiales bacterium]